MDACRCGWRQVREFCELAFAHAITLFELTPQRASLEEVFMDLTADSVEYGSHDAGTA